MGTYSLRKALWIRFRWDSSNGRLAVCAKLIGAMYIMQLGCVYVL